MAGAGRAEQRACRSLSRPHRSLRPYLNCSTRHRRRTSKTARLTAFFIHMASATIAKASSLAAMRERSVFVTYFNAQIGSLVMVVPCPTSCDHWSGWPERKLL